MRLSFVPNACFVLWVFVTAAAVHADRLTPRTIEFSGETWAVRSGFGGPGPNPWSYSEDSVWVDSQGQLHLEIRRIEGRWHSVQITTEQTVGYGDYEFLVVGGLEDLHEDVVLGLFLYQDDTKEIDIEIAKWGDPLNGRIGNYTVQPYHIAGNTKSFALGLTGTHTTHGIRWLADEAVFTSYHGHHGGVFDHPPAQHLLIDQWAYAGGDVPEPDRVRLNINLWLFQGAQATDFSGAEVVIRRARLVAAPEPAGVALLGMGLSLIASRRTRPKPRPRS